MFSSYSKLKHADWSRTDWDYKFPPFKQIYTSKPFLVANSNSSNSCTPSVCQSLGRLVTHCEIIFIWGGTVQSPGSTSTVHHIVHCTVQLFIQSIVLFIVQLNVQIIVQFITIKKTRLFATRGFSTLFSNARPLSLLFLVYIFVISFRWMFLMKWKFLI